MNKQSYAKRVYQVVGKAIAEARKRSVRRITQAQLADRTDGALSRSAIANIERGRQRIAVHHLYLIAESLEIEPGKLLPSISSTQGKDQLSLDNELTADPKLRQWLKRIVREPVAGLE